MPTTMRAVAIDNFGGPETMKTRTLRVPDVAPDEILVRLESAGVGEWDPFEREGGFATHYGTTYSFPFVLGSDGAGTVEAVGSKVTRFKTGDRVYALSIFNAKGGCYAEYVVVKEDRAGLIPENLSTEAAGPMAVDAITALRGLDDALGLKSGETVMIFGASGGIGHLAVQLAQRMGARVFAVASGPDGVELVRRLGAAAAVDGKKDDVAAAARAFAPGGLDAALVTAGGDAADRALTAVKDGGRVAHPNGVEPVPKVRAGVTIKAYDGEPDPAAMDKLNRLIAAGPFEVHIHRSFPLDQAAQAHQALEAHHLGKLALRLN